MVGAATRSSRYEVLAKIATGGMATVYVARARGAVGFSRLVAIKRPHPFVTADLDLRRQLEAEARVASMIHHPNVVSVLDVEEIDGELVLVMDYVEGCTLKVLVDHAVAAGLPFARVVVRVLLDVAAGLQAAHRVRDGSGALLGVVHRDVSPQNVLVGVDGAARLTDFGIAKIAAADADPTSSDVMKGKLAYLAPEYIAHRRYEARSDLFALAVVAWEALAGQRLFKGATTVETLLNIVDGRTPLLGSVRPELAPLEGVIAAALARTPEERPDSVLAFATALEQAARAAGGVATHEEVGALVEQAAGTVIAERRQMLETAVPRALDGVEDARPLSARDQMETASLAAPPASAPPPALATLAPSSPLPRPAPPRARSFRATAALAVLVTGAFVSTALVLTLRRAAAPAPATVADAAPPAVALSAAVAAPVDSAATPAGSGSAAASASAGQRGRPVVHPPPRASASPLPAHAPPNPYAH